MPICIESKELEGRAEIHLQWKTLMIIALLMILPLFGAILFKSIIIKIICWAMFLFIYMMYLPYQGPCVTAIAVMVCPWYIFVDWFASQKWLGVIATIITLIEISYIRHRMHFIKIMREKEESQSSAGS